MVDVDFAEMITLILDEEMDIESRDFLLTKFLNVVSSQASAAEASFNSLKTE